MFSKATEYALRATIFIARTSDEDNKLSLDEVAKGINSPPSFTAKILQKLTANNRVVSSTRGPNGGFFMTDKAKNLSARAILEAMEEDQVLEKCVLGLKQCSEARPCPMHAEYRSIKATLKKLFETTSIRQLADDLNKGEGRTGARKTILSQ